MAKYSFLQSVRSSPAVMQGANNQATRVHNIKKDITHGKIPLDKLTFKGLVEIYKIDSDTLRKYGCTGDFIKQNRNYFKLHS